MTGTPQFVDISGFQGSIDFSAYCAWARQWDGVSRIAMKATEGVGFTDPSFESHRAGAIEAGIDQILYYHFARPDLGNSAQAEADSMCSVIGAIRSGDMIFLDYEVEAPQATDAWALAWLLRQQSSYGKAPGIYSYASYVATRLQNPALEAFPLWYASWTYNPDARPTSPSPWSGGYMALQFTDQGTNTPGITGYVDCNIFLGGQNVKTYSPNSADFNTFFTVDANGNWVCTSTGAVIIGGNKAAYSEISIDGNTLPVLGLPRTPELYHQESDGYSWSVQFFERGVIVYDPSHRLDAQPGFGSSYIGKYEQFIALDPNYQQPAADPKLTAAISTVRDDVAMMVRIAGL